MRRLTLIIAVMGLLLAACNKASEEESIEQKEINEEETEELAEATEEEEMEEEAEEDVAENEQTNDIQAKSDEAKKNDKSTEKQNDTWTKPDKIDNMDHLDIVHLAYDIFEAQDRKDYDFLYSVVAKGVSVDEVTDKFIFENFDMNFFTKEELGELEFRYTHEEEEDGSVIVGFGAINYKEESSFVVDYTFVQESGTWKMLDMDINK